MILPGLQILILSMKLALLNNGTILHFLHKDDTLNMNWSALKPKAKKCFEYMNENYGLYPYGQYSIIRGAMEEWNIPCVL